MARFNSMVPSWRSRYSPASPSIRAAAVRLKSPQSLISGRRCRLTLRASQFPSGLLASAVMQMLANRKYARLQTRFSNAQFISLLPTLRKPIQIAVRRQARRGITLVAFDQGWNLVEPDPSTLIQFAHHDA